MVTPANRVDIEEAISLSNKLLAEHDDKPLSEEELAILRGTWQKANFKVIASNLGLNGRKNVDYLRTCIGRRLWIRLATAYEAEGLMKHTFKSIVEKRVAMLREEQSEKTPLKKILDTSQGFSVLIGQPPSVDGFIGRAPETAMLEAAVQENQCISIIGPPGIGKSALASKLVNTCYQQPDHCSFEVCIWKSILYAPSIDYLLKDILEHVGVEIGEKDTQALISDLLSCLRQHRILVVLDSVEAAMIEGDRNNPWGNNPEYRPFVRRIIEEQHESCFVLCSQEPIREIDLLQSNGFSARSFRIEGLGKDAITLLKQAGLKDESNLKTLILDYQGNPYALLEVAENIKTFFDGSVADFLDLETIRIDDAFTQTLLNQILKLSDLEQAILIDLAKLNPKSIEFRQLCHMYKNQSMSDLMSAITRLENRSLINKSQDKPFQISVSKIVKKLVMIQSSSDTHQSDYVFMTA